MQFEKEKIKAIEELDVFKLSHEVALEVYRLTRSFPKEEVYGLVSQMRRCCVSVNSNLKEGGGRASGGEFRHFVGIARGSAAELEYQVEISMDLEFMKEEDSAALISKIKRVQMMLNKLLASIK